MAPTPSNQARDPRVILLKCETNFEFENTSVELLEKPESES